MIVDAESHKFFIEVNSAETRLTPTRFTCGPRVSYQWSPSPISATPSLSGHHSLIDSLRRWEGGRRVGGRIFFLTRFDKFTKINHAGDNGSDLS